MPLKIVAFLTLLTLAATCLAESPCNICKRCSFCSGSVLSDCQVDVLYAKIISQNSQIANAYPITITKTTQYTRTLYFFQFSNNFNVTVTITNNATSNNNFIINSPQVLNITISGGSNANGSSPAETKPNLAQGNGSSAGGNGTVNWVAAENAGALILAFAKRHYYLSSDAGIMQILQDLAVNVYNTLIASKDSIYQIKARINNGSVSVLSISLAVKSDNKSNNGSLPNGGTSANLNNNSANLMVGMNSGGQSLKEKQINGVKVNQTQAALVNYLYGAFGGLKLFQLKALNISGNFTYQLQFLLSTNKSLIYLIQVQLENNINLQDSPTYRIIKAGWSNPIPSKFTDISSPSLYYQDVFAAMITPQMKQFILNQLRIGKASLVKVQASPPFYRLNYQYSANNATIIVSYDPIYQQLKLLSYTLFLANGSIINGQGQDISKNISNIASSHSTPVQSLNLVPAKIVQNNLPVSSISEVNTTITPLDITQIAFTPSKLNNSPPSEGSSLSLNSSKLQTFQPNKTANPQSIGPQITSNSSSLSLNGAPQVIQSSPPIIPKIPSSSSQGIISTSLPSNSVPTNSQISLPSLAGTVKTPTINPFNGTGTNFIRLLNSSTNIIANSSNHINQSIFPTSKGVILNNLLTINPSSNELFQKIIKIISQNSSASFQSKIASAWQTYQSNTVIQYLIDLNYSLDSSQLLQFTVSYNSSANSITLADFSYTPAIDFGAIDYKQLSLQNINNDIVLMKIISSIFMSYPLYFESAVSRIVSVGMYTPYYRVRYQNSHYGQLSFDVVYNYFMQEVDISSYSVGKTSISQPQKSAPQTQTIVTSPSTNIPNKFAPSIKEQHYTQAVQPQLSTATLISNNPTQISDNSHCLQYTGSTCSKCIPQYYLNTLKKICLKFPPNCSSFDYQTALCLICSTGYALVQGRCSR